MIKTHLDISIIQDDEVTAAALIVPEGFVSAVGSAKRHPKDEPVEVIGIHLALGRLFANLSADYLATAQAMIDAPRLGVPALVDADPSLVDWMKNFGIPEAEMGS